ncbi:HpcH/HpaI aldolase family protein [Phaeovulum sp. W22_SRMD_FR3]|uniref:HpcH/HpaI aldolase family protein n=1 Tax=Phaeovulum sp. W22_SRMD_FR3 TaxID=3240274 RepID=UPI003F9A9BC0
MNLPPNHFKAALRAGQRQIGLWSSLADPNAAELLAGCGYDWMMFDTEHSTASLNEVVGFLRALAPYPVSAVVRPGWNNPVEIKKLLDAGAQTLLIPYVQNAEEARAAVAAVTYPPHGLRGVSGITRATRYGAVAGYATRAQEEICLLVQVETREALLQLREIAQVPGVDGVFFGPADLAASLGHPGQPSHPEVRKAILDGIGVLGDLGVPAGILSLDQDFLREAKAAGALFIAVDIDSGLLRRAALARRAEWS